MANEHPMRDFSCKLCTVLFLQEITRLYCTLLLLGFFCFVFSSRPLRIARIVSGALAKRISEQK